MSIPLNSFSNKYDTNIWNENAFVDATPISRPQFKYIERDANLSSVEFGEFEIVNISLFTL